jgi:Ran GTPase-activating protein (RanGAP) involved in mRNA processing and transport
VTVVTRLESLSSTDIGELSKWLREKAKPQITTLSISNSDIDDKAAIALAKVIKPQSKLNKLTTLQVGHKLSKLATLELIGNTISDEGFKTLAKAIQNNLTITMLKIDLVGSTNSDQGIQTLANAISTNRTITKLMIRVGKKISGEALDALTEMVGKNETIKELVFKGFQLRNEESKKIKDASFDNPKCKFESVIFVLICSYNFLNTVFCIAR